MRTPTPTWIITPMDRWMNVERSRRCSNVSLTPRHISAQSAPDVNVAAAAAFDGAFTAEEATVPAAAPPTTQPTDVLVDLRARLANLKRDIESHARARA